MVGKMSRVYQGKLSRRQAKQVKNIINSTKQWKIGYTPVLEPLTDLTGATPLPTSFMEITAVPTSGGANPENSYERETPQIMLNSFNIKMGICYYTNDIPSSYLAVVPFRVIIVRTRLGPITDILDTASPPVSVVDFNQQPNNNLYQVLSDEIITISGQANVIGTNVSPGYHLKFYKKFKKGKIPYLLVRYTPGDTPALENGIYMKVIADPSTPAGDSYNFLLSGFACCKYYEKD